MRAAYHNLLHNQCKNKCSNIYDDIRGAFFKWAKDLWDYEYNFSTLKGHPDCSGYTSNPEYIRQLEAAKKAYSKLCEKCNDEDSVDSYCVNYKRKHNINRRKCTAEGPTELKCNKILEPVVQAPVVVETIAVQHDQGPGIKEQASKPEGTEEETSEVNGEKYQDGKGLELSAKDLQSHSGEELGGVKEFNTMNMEENIRAVDAPSLPGSTITASAATLIGMSLVTFLLYKV
ncbi:hypothetical protein PCYB_002810 [Plasmodium cynomolgi strain B]|uniref:Uncharacterized protein n=1 Tax=Plasmodium cynomolgi (strain B) TaxID=1120755 RepID=K6VJF8_PLACD|nr:hypothetical protein PCYB_002810 [Plasmodium cynomolgi strain B]GAB69532.1 hypothetical protein PCYB_002810 [Plasmodium cynomolgi strain B]